MKKVMSIALALCVCTLVYGQKTKNLVVPGNTYDIVEKGIEYNDQGKYKEALAEFAKVPIGDPEYENAQYEIALVQSETGDMHGAVQTLEKMLSKPVHNVRMNLPYILLGSCYDELGQPEKALEAYNKVLERYPYSYLGHFNKGVTLYGMERYEEAVECFKKSIWLYPAHAGSHYYYGLCNLLIGYTVPGILALNYSILLNTSSNNAIRALQTLDDLYGSGVSEFNNEYHVEISDEIEDLNQLYAPLMLKINTKYAESKHFKSLSKIDQELVRGNQMVFEEVLVRPNSHAIEDQLYIPFFKSVLAQKNVYNVLSYYQLSETDVDNGKVSAKAIKMQGQIQTLIEMLVRQLREAVTHGIGVDNPEANVYMYSNYFELRSWGKSVQNFNQIDGNQDVIRDGKWMVINNGQLYEIDSYSNGKLNGICSLYEDNELSREYPFVNNVVNGTARSYFVNPYTHEKILNSVTEVVNGVENGLYQEYNKAGILVAEEHLKDGRVEGDMKFYDDCGNIASILSLAEDGTTTGTYYLPDGKVGATIEKEGQNLHIVKYYANGAKSEDYYTRDDKTVGVYTQFFQDGHIKSMANFDENGERVGEQIWYHRNGNVDTREEWQSGKRQKLVNYGVDGKPMDVFEGKNGELVSAKTLNADSSVRETFTIKNGKLTVTYYSHHGYKHSTRTYNLNWEPDGPITVYYPNGQIKVSGNYKNDLWDGVYHEYYRNGRLKQYAYFENGLKNGMSISYMNNAENSVEQESYYHNDTVQGASYAYFPDGNIKSLSCFDVNGRPTYNCEYYPDDKMEHESFCYDGLCYVTRHFDRDGQVVHSDTLYNGTGSVKFYYPNGQLQYEVPMVCGLAHGLARLYDLKGDLLDTMHYQAGEIHGRYVDHSWDGSADFEANMVFGKKDGKTKTHFENGTTQEQYFENDLTQGTLKRYNEDGKLEAEMPIVDEERQGRCVYYAPDGKTVLYELIREADKLVAIATMQADGKMSAPVMLNGDEQKFTAYYPTGKVGCVLSFNKGCYDGVTTTYYPNGQAYSVEKFKSSLFDGTSVSYYPNGNVRTELVYKDDCLHGKFKKYYDNGQVSVEGNYYYDMPHGEFKKYDKNGKLVRKVILIYGSKVADESYE